MSEKVSWASYGKPEKDQGNCGSCAWFGTIKTLEMLLKIRAGDPNLPIDYSEQDLGACSGSSCEQGSLMENILNTLMTGICTEECLSYKARTTACGEGRCAEWEKTGIKIKSWTKITNWEDMKIPLRKGPIVGTMAVHQSFTNYAGGLYKSQGIMDPIIGYHCICLDGFDESLNAVQLINSWSFWGMVIEGVAQHALVDKDDSEISVESYLIELDGEIPPQPEPGPTPSPCEKGNGIARRLNQSPTLRQYSKMINRVLNPFLWFLHRKGRFYSFAGRFYYLNPLPPPGDPCGC